MTKPKLYYFDIPASRGEECRLAFSIAGVDFEDVRVKSDEWRTSMKPASPFGSMPYLELPGKPALGQSVAILTYIGRTYGLHPTDLFEAARHEAMMAHAEDLRHAISPTLFIRDEAEKKKAREAIVAERLQPWAGFAEKQISDDGPFFAGAKIHVVDVKLHMLVAWIAGGKLDHFPSNSFDAYPKLMRVYEAVGAHEAVKAWRAKAR